MEAGSSGETLQRESRMERKTRKGRWVEKGKDGWECLQKHSEFKRIESVSL